MYSRVRHLDLNCVLENLALLKAQVRENPGVPIPNSWRVSSKKNLKVKITDFIRDLSYRLSSVSNNAKVRR